MKKIYLTLMLLLMATGIARANCYLSIDEFEVTLEQKYQGEMIKVPVHAHFDARVQTIFVDFILPEGLDFDFIWEGNDAIVPYLDGQGQEQSSYPWFEDVDEPGRYHFEISANDPNEVGYWDPMGNGALEPYGAVKWEAGDYDKMFFINLIPNSDFWGGEIHILVTPYSENDPRGGTVLENGDDGQVFETVTEVTCEPEQTPMPEFIIDYPGWNITQITAVGEGEIHLYLFGEEVENPYYIQFTPYGDEYYFEATAQAPNKLISETATFFYCNPTYPEPWVEMSQTMTEDSVIINIECGETMYLDIQVNGNSYYLLEDFPYHYSFGFPRTDEDQSFEVVVTAIGEFDMQNSVGEFVIVPARGDIYDFEQDGIYYKIIAENQVCVTFRDMNFNSYSGEVTIPEAVTHEGVTYNVVAIRGKAFFSCTGLTSVIIPASVTTIGDHAFYYCYKLTGIAIPSSVKSIADDAFDNCNGLKRVDITDLMAWLDINFSNSFSNPLRYAHRLYLNGNEITELEIPDGITAIGNYMFEGASYLTSVSIPSSVNTIGYSAFDCRNLTRVDITDLAAWCGIRFYNAYSNPLAYAHHLYLNGNEVTSVRIPSNITEVNNYLFYGCYGLESVVFGDAVTKVGTDAFRLCNNLASVTCLATTPPTLAYDAFYPCISTAHLYVPEASLEAYQASYSWKRFRYIVGIPGAGPGDVSGDGQISITDVTTMINAILSGDEDVLNNPYADVNGDGRVNISDITTLITMLLSGSTGQ